MADDKSVVNRLKKIFGITMGTKAVKSVSTNSPVVPGTYNRETNRVDVVKFSSQNQKLLDYWMNDVFDSPETLKERVNRYKDLDYAYYNSPIISMAIDLYTDETVQADSQSQILQVTAKESKVEKYINEFFEKLGVTQKLIRNVAFDLALYGDHFWVNVTKGNEGITRIIPIDVYSVTDRMEFNAIRVQEQMKQRGIDPIQRSTKASRLDALIKIYKEDVMDEDYSQFFKTFLFGYVLSETQYLPPWNVTHFRRYATKSEFAPYGRPILINSISPFKQLQTSKNLMALARVNKFPRETFGVDTAETMTEASKWEAVNQARQEFENLGADPTNKDQFAIGGQIWYPKDIVDYSLEENTISMDDIADVEMLRDDLIMGTRVPKGYLIVDQASFGTSGQALLQQFKPFGRAVYSNQSVIMEELANLIRLQWVMTGDFPIDTEFELTMSFPVVEESADRTRAKSDSFGLAKDIIDGIATVVGLETSELPPDVVKDILATFSFLSKEEIDDWVDLSIKKKEKDKKEGEYKDPDTIPANSLGGQGFGDDNEDSSNGNTFSSTDGNYFEHYYRRKHPLSEAQVQERLRRISKPLIKEQYFKSKRKLRMIEGVSNKRHYFSPFEIDGDQRKYFEIVKKEYIIDNRVEG